MALEKKTVLGEGVCPPFSNFSQGLMIDGGKRLLFIAGQFPLDENGDLVGRGRHRGADAQGLRQHRSALQGGGRLPRECGAP